MTNEVEVVEKMLNDIRSEAEMDKEKVVMKLQKALEILDQKIAQFPASVVSKARQEMGL